MVNSVINDFGTWWIESIMLPRSNIAFGTRTIFPVTLAKAGRCMSAISCADFDANAARHVSVAITGLSGVELTIDQFITGINLLTNNHGTSDASVSSKAILFMRP